MRQQGVNEEDTADKLYHYCDECGKKFSDVSTLARHKINIHNPVPTACTVCGLTFQSEQKMKIHYNNEHNPKQCDFCDYKTGYSSHMKAHMAKHSEPKFKCSHCDKVLKSKLSLEGHEREHTGERPFECQVCGKGFTRSCSLITHKKHVHKILTPGMKPIDKRK